jgi:hypothetical protein
MLDSATLSTAALASTFFALGSIWFGRFESGAPAWRRTLRLAIVVGVCSTLSATLGALWGLGLLGALATAGLAGHFLWCRKHGIDPWTAEPWERYRRLRGWSS